MTRMRSSFFWVVSMSISCLPVVLVLLSQLILLESASAQKLTSDHLSEFSWRTVGPTATGGRVVDIAVDPNDKNTIYVASASGGLWRTENNGTTWKVIFEKERTLSIGDIAIDPNDSDTIWVGTGEANNQRSSFWGDGVYKSIDGGASWENVGLADSHHIGRIVVDPNDSNIVYVAALGHLYTSNEERGLFKTIDGGKTWDKVLYISPEVGVSDVVIDHENPNIILAASYERLRRPWNFDGAGPGSAIYRSEDGGNSFKKMTKGLPQGEIGRIGLDIYRGQTNIVYACVSNQNEYEQKSGGLKIDEPESGKVKIGLGFEVTFDDDGCKVAAVAKNSVAMQLGLRANDRLINIGDQDVTSKKNFLARFNTLRLGDSVEVVISRGGKEANLEFRIPQSIKRQVGGEIYRSDNGGLKWKKQNENAVGGSPGYYYGQIRIDPNDDKRLYVLGVPLATSSDAGKTWSNDGARSVHVDHHALWIDPDNSGHVLLGNDGGFHLSYDRAQTWDYVFNIPLAQFYAIGVDMQKPYHVYGGLQDNGSFGGPSKTRSRSGIGRFDWYRVGGGDGFYVQVDPKDSDIIVAESQFGVIGRLDRETGMRRSIRPPQSDPRGPRDRYNWNSPIVMSQHDSRVIYFAGNRLFKTFNYGDDWQVISPDLTTANPAKISGNVPHCTITTISESPLDKRVLCVGTDDGKVQWSNDGGATWTDMSDRFSIRPQGWWCTRVELSHHDINTAYASFSAFREDDFRSFVFATRDGGATWNSITSNLPEEPVNVIKEDLRNRNLLFVGTEFGVHVSADAGQNWLSLNDGLPRVSVQDLLIHPREMDLVIGTHGRGIYIMDDITALQELNPKTFSEAAYLFKTRTATRWASKSGQTISGDRRAMYPNPPAGVAISYFLKSDVDPKDIKLEVQDEDGKRVGTLKVDPAAGLHRVIWNFSGTGRSRRGPRTATSGLNSLQRHYTVVLQLKDIQLSSKISVSRDPLLD